MWADYSIEKLKPLRDVHRFDDNRGNRFYWFMDGEEVRIAAGVTSVFGLVSTERKALEMWKDNNDDWRNLLKVSAEYGTAVHTQYGRILTGQSIDRGLLMQMQELASENGASYDMPSKDILSFLKFKEDYQLEPLIIEGVLTWVDPEGECLAMTIDLLARFTKVTPVKRQVEDGVYQRGVNKGKPKFKDVVDIVEESKIVIVDFKSNFFEKEKKTFYEAHKMQLMSAKLAVEQNFDIKVDAVFNYSGNAWRTEPSYTLFEQKIVGEDWKIFSAYWELAKAKNLNKPEGKILLTGDFKNSADFKYLDYPTYVKEVLLVEQELIPAKEDSVLTLLTGE